MKKPHGEHARLSCPSTHPILIQHAHSGFCVTALASPLPIGEGSIDFSKPG
jgi:hypothetical protein